MKLSVSSTFIDHDAVELVRGVHLAVRDGQIPAEFSCIISTRDHGDHSMTDDYLHEIKTLGVPVICCSAKKFGRLRETSYEVKARYDAYVLDAINKSLGELPDVNMMLGDMIVKSEEWCRRLPSLNLHPDIPLKLGGVEGIYWDVVGRWIKDRRSEIGGMMHLAVPTPDAGTPVAYFRLPARGVVNGVNLGELWTQLPAGEEERAALIGEQTALKDQPTHPLFQALRRAEARYEPRLVIEMLGILAKGKIQLMDGNVCDREGRMLTNGYDLTDFVVGDDAVWPGGEGGGRRGYERI